MRSRSPVSQAPLPARLPGLLPGFFRCPGTGTDTSAGAPLAGGQEPTGRTQTGEHQGSGLSEPGVRCSYQIRGIIRKASEKRFVGLFFVSVLENLAERVLHWRPLGQA